MVKQNLLKSQANLAKRYNRNWTPVPLKIGDLVYYRNHLVSHAGHKITAKLLHRWKGPFKVDKFLTPVTVRLVDPTTGKFVTWTHVSLLKLGPHLRRQACGGCRRVMRSWVFIVIRCGS